jgi:hypothetical protein
MHPGTQEAEPAPEGNPRSVGQWLAHAVLPRGDRPRRFYERWRWIEWLWFLIVAYVIGYFVLTGQYGDPGVAGAIWVIVIPTTIGYWIISYFINLSERQCSSCGERARKTETFCNSCGEPL